MWGILLNKQSRAHRPGKRKSALTHSTLFLSALFFLLGSLPVLEAGWKKSAESTEWTKHGRGMGQVSLPSLACSVIVRPPMECMGPWCILPLSKFWCQELEMFNGPEGNPEDSEIALVGQIPKAEAATWGLYWLYFQGFKRKPQHYSLAVLPVPPTFPTKET